MLELPQVGDDQRSGGWHQDRAGSVTGSVFADAIAFKRDKTETAARRDLRLRLIVERMTGIAQVNGFKSDAMEWGTKTEPDARFVYSMFTGNLVEEVGFMPHPTIQWCGVSLDGLVGDEGTIEIKCPNPMTHIHTILMRNAALSKLLLGTADDKDRIPVPEEHLPQIQGGLWVSNRQWCDFISYDPRFPEALRLYVQRVPRDDAYIKTLEEGLAKFLDEVETGLTQILGVDAASADAAPEVNDIFAAMAATKGATA